MLQHDFAVKEIRVIAMLIFSSPEHKVLSVSYCDRSLSVVRRRPSCVVRHPSSVNVFTQTSSPLKPLIGF